MQKVGLGIVEEWESRNTRLEAAWVYANGGFTKDEAIALASKDVAELLGLKDGVEGAAVEESWVAYEGDFFGMSGRVRAVSAAGRDTVDLF